MLNSWKARFSHLLPFRAELDSFPRPGLYHYLKENGDEKVRIHLRIEPDGRGLMVINAARMIHFNSSAALMAYLFLEGLSKKDVVKALTGAFHVSAAQALADYGAVQGQMESLLHPDGACLIHDLGLETLPPFSVTPSAPYRMDLAITYRCNNNCSHCYNGRPRTFPEMDTQNWYSVLDSLWKVGIPHIVFTGGEPTLREDLPKLISHAESNGQITGINTNGRKLKDKDFLDSLITAGLDHAQFTVESHDLAIHDGMVRATGAWKDTIAGLKNALATRLYVMTNTTLLENNAAKLYDTLAFLRDLGVPTIGLNALIYSGKGESVGTGIPEKDLPELMNLAQKFTTESGQRLIWYTPTQYCHFDPMQLELGVKGCTAALYNMCVEPDGSVIPCQSYYSSLGNVLTDSWNSIWNHDLAKKLRNHTDIPTACTQCSLLSECGGGCPLARQTNHTQPVQIHSLPADYLEV